ncbi:MAG: hypothetical protein KJ747_00480 [Actinobacteria bacterium]|nr:hypothetical protein [Actinomycetota bacterium]
MLRRFRTVPVLIGLTLVTLAGLAALVTVCVGAYHADNRTLTAARTSVPTSDLWPTNASGHTYGTPTGTPYDYREPDLIKVCATNGKTGYSVRADLEGPTPASPEEALRLQAEQTGQDRVIPVFESDGVTQIGVFVCE